MNRTRTRSRTRSRVAFRGFLAACLLAVTAGACTAERPETLVVLGPWTGDEGEAFEAMLNKLDDGTGQTYTYQGTRSLRETLVAQLEADAPPDVAILNSLGELTEYARAGRLRPLTTTAAARAYPPWAPPLSVDGTRRTYWVPLKVDLKSLVWRKAGQGARSAAAPKWCVALASQATSGWPGTDWIEDILLHRAGPDVYTEWATGRLSWRDPRVRDAWTTWAALLGKRSKASVDQSLTMSYVGTPDPAANGGGAPRGLLGSMTPRCTHEHQSAFIRYVYADDDRVRVDPAAGFLRGVPPTTAPTRWRATWPPSSATTRPPAPSSSACRAARPARCGARRRSGSCGRSFRTRPTPSRPTPRDGASPTSSPARRTRSALTPRT